MTNEQIATDIQTSSDKDLTELLWNRTKGICFKLAGKYYSRYAEKFNLCGVEFEDVRQECYFAFLQAVKAYKSDSGLKFTSYLNYPILNACRDLLGIRNKEGLNRSPLDNYTSLDVPINAEEENEITLLDTVEDVNALADYEHCLDCISDAQTKSVLEKAIGRLKPPLQAVIYEHYFNNETFSDIAEKENVSIQNISNRNRQALSQLRRTPEVRLLWEEMHEEKYLHSPTRQYTYSDYLRERGASEVLRRGSLLTDDDRRRILFDCKVESALDNSPEYQLYKLLASQK